MNNKVLLITGGSSEIGINIINKFLKKNIKVIAHYNFNLPKLSHKNLKWIQFDFSNPEKISEFFIKVKDLNCEIDFLVLASGIIENKDYLEINYNDLKKIYNINFFCHYLIIKHYFQIMLKRRFGRIISLSSIGVKYSGSPRSVVYSSSKAALEAITKSFSKMGAQYNILCNNIRVGVIKTKIHIEKDMSDRLRLIPQKRFGKTEDIASMVLYLCLSGGDFITGQDMSISGGE